MNSKIHDNADVVPMITELGRKFYQKLDDQLFIIQQQRDRIDYQQQQINDQRVIIEELAWQIRDLRYSVRKCSEQLRTTSPQSGQSVNEENESRETKAQAEIHHNRADLNPIYESINFDSAQSVTALNHLESNRNRNHHHANDKDSKNVNDERDVQKFLEKCIPPPPNSSPPECDSDSDLDPIQISSETFKKLNELYEMSRYVRNSNYKSSDSDDVVYRFREVKDFSTRAKRGSSKTLWSFVPDIDVEYLPRLDEEYDDIDDVDDMNSFNEVNNIKGSQPQSHQYLRQKSDDEIYI